ncbi:MAG: LysR family transcriptional regulator [Pseudomonadota bacterium]
MEFKQLRYFKRVADAGSVSRAAAAMSVAQPAVSRQIANLEETLGTPLFFRNGRGVTLTEAGQQLYHHTQTILDSVRMAKDDVREQAGVARGTILIGSMPSVVQMIAPPLLAKVAKSHPELVLEFTAGFSGTVNEWLSNGLLDIAIIHDATRTQHFLTEPLMRERLVLVGDRRGGETIPLADLCTLPLVLPRRIHGLRIQLERATAQERLSLNVRYEMDCHEATRRLLEEGSGMTVQPEGMAAESFGAFATTPIGSPQLARQLVLATSSQRPVSQTTRTIIQDLKAVVRQLIQTQRWAGALSPQDGRANAQKPAPAVVDLRAA